MGALHQAVYYPSPVDQWFKRAQPYGNGDSLNPSLKVRRRKPIISRHKEQPGKVPQHGTKPNPPRRGPYKEICDMSQKQIGGCKIIIEGE